MEYKKIENEIDTLLHNGGLNPYERKLLRKVKRKFCADRVAEKDYFEIMGRAATERNKVVFEKRCERLIKKNKRLREALEIYKTALADGLCASRKSTAIFQ